MKTNIIKKSGICTAPKTSMYCNTRDNKQICFCVITFNKTKKSHIILDCTVTSQNENMIKCFSSMICA